MKVRESFIIIVLPSIISSACIVLMKDKLDFLRSDCDNPHRGGGVGPRIADTDSVWTSGSIFVFCKNTSHPLYILSVSYITANMHCICLGACFMFAEADAVQICGNVQSTLYLPKL